MSTLNPENIRDPEINPEIFILQKIHIIIGMLAYTEQRMILFYNIFGKNYFTT